MRFRFLTWRQPSFLKAEIHIKGQMEHMENFESIWISQVFTTTTRYMKGSKMDYAPMPMHWIGS